MTRLRDGARQTMAWLHGWSGLLLGHILYVIAFAGTLSVFKPEIGRWMRPEKTATADPLRAAGAAVAWLTKNAPDSTGWYLGLPDGRANTVEAYFDHSGKNLYRALDPITGAPIARETLGGEFFYRLHFELQLPYPWGRLIASVAAAMMLIALISGIFAHRRFFRDFFTFRPGKGQRSWLDAHNVLGVLSLPFHLMITFTGIATLITLSFPWAAAAVYGADSAAMYRDQTPGTVDRSAIGRRIPLAPVAAMIGEAQRRCDGAVGRVSIVNPGDAGAVVTAFCSDASQVASSRGAVSFDGTTGRMIGASIERRPVMVAYNTLYGLHMARFAPDLLRWLYFLGGAMLTAAIATGLQLWTVKRSARGGTRANGLLERVNAGMLIGVPVGAAAFLWANRLLPLGSEGRAEHEVAISLATWGAVTIAATALRPRNRWPALFGLATVALVVAPWLGGWRSADVVQCTGNIMLLALGGAFALCAKRGLAR